ncbi:MAG: flagellar filament capping protein FliD [Panacagrimonas sp.]
MAITSSGVGSGLDVNSIVTQLVSSERKAADTRISVAQTTTRVKISALGTTKSVLTNLQSALSKLKTGEALTALSAKSSHEALLTASGSSGAVAGSYGVEVVELARGNKLVSTPYASAAASVGSGSFTFSSGGESFTVTLVDGANSLADLRNAINNATDNSGVSAAIINESGGSRLVLSARDTGLVNSVTLTAGALTLTEQQIASDAHVRIEGFDHYSPSNQVTTAVDGVSFNLLKAEPGTTATITLSADPAAATSAIKGFVKAYNTWTTTIASLTKYDAASDTAGVLLGDGAVRTLRQQLRSMVGESVDDAGTYSALAQIGITSATDGTLTVDDARLSAALGADAGSVQRLFGGSEGLSERLVSVLDRYLGTGGQLASSTDALNARTKELQRQQDKLDQRMSAVEARYRRQFIALDSVIASLQGTQSYLTQQLASLNSN